MADKYNLHRRQINIASVRGRQISSPSVKDKYALHTRQLHIVFKRDRPIQSSYETTNILSFPYAAAKYRSSLYESGISSPYEPDNRLVALFLFVCLSFPRLFILSYTLINIVVDFANSLSCGIFFPVFLAVILPVLLVTHFPHFRISTLFVLAPFIIQAEPLLLISTNVPLLFPPRDL